MRDQFFLSINYLLYPARYLLVFFVLFFGSLAGYLLYGKLFHRKTKPEILARILLIDVIITILIVTIVSTLSGNIPGVASLDLVPFHTLQDEWVMGDGIKYFSVAMNIIMFMPLGFLLPLVLKKFQHWYMSVPFCLLFSVLIEFLQYFIGRSSDIDDVLANTFGGLLGYLIFFILKVRIRSRTKKEKKERKERKEKRKQAL